MDHSKINYDLIVALLEWIVGEEHEVINLFIQQYIHVIYFREILIIIHVQNVFRLGGAQVKFGKMRKFFRFFQTFLSVTKWFTENNEK